MSTTGNSSMQTPYTIYHGGEILTMEGDEPSYAECVVISDANAGGKIVYIGNLDSLDIEMRSKGKWIDLKGNCVLPGFIDPHIHPSMAAVLLSTHFITPFDWSLPDRPQVNGVRSEKDYHQGKLVLIAHTMKKWRNRNLFCEIKKLGK